MNRREKPIDLSHFEIEQVVVILARALELDSYCYLEVDTEDVGFYEPSYEGRLYLYIREDMIPYMGLP